MLISFKKNDFNGRFDFVDVMGFELELVDGWWNKKTGARNLSF